jgi:exopolyphosphatase/pppGpp-phosphohydrolase
MNFEGAKKFILNKLSRELDPRLVYHSINHTLDVYDSAVRIAKMEKIPETETQLLTTAALFHDSGMLVTYKGHEEASVTIIKDILPGYNYSSEEISRIETMIRTTKIPQSADERLSMILCDADLDYLGREDYFMISHQLKYEWDVLNINPTTLKEWYQLQVSFLENHKYFTMAALETRQTKKESNLLQVYDILQNDHIKKIQK